MRRPRASPLPGGEGEKGAGFHPEKGTQEREIVTNKAAQKSIHIPFEIERQNGIS